MSGRSHEFAPSTSAAVSIAARALPLDRSPRSAVQGAASPAPASSVAAAASSSVEAAADRPWLTIRFHPGEEERPFPTICCQCMQSADQWVKALPMHQANVLVPVCSDCRNAYRWKTARLLIAFLLPLGLVEAALWYYLPATEAMVRLGIAAGLGFAWIVIATAMACNLARPWEVSNAHRRLHVCIRFKNAEFNAMLEQMRDKALQQLPCLDPNWQPDLTADDSWERPRGEGRQGW